MDIYSMILESYNIAAIVFAHIVGFALAFAAAAIILAVAALILIGACAVIAAAFDGITRHMAKRMAQKGKRPRTKAGRIILASLEKDGGV